MSFAGQIKEELLDQIGKARHCQIAEIIALFSGCGQVLFLDDGRCQIKFATENLTVAKKCYILIRRAFHMVPDCSVISTHQYTVSLLCESDASVFMKAVGVEEGAWLATSDLIERSCCRRAFLRGIFLVYGSMTDPHSGYHLEFVMPDMTSATHIQEIMGFFELEAKIIGRKKNYVVYMKEGEAISDFLNVVGAHKALMEFENIRILKDMRNSINRQVNCETANIKKTVSAASRQTADIHYIHDTIGFGNLSEQLSQIAKLRLEYPDMTLKELGEMLDPPIGKSGVNHRLRKLSQIADDLRLQGGKHDKEKC